MIHDACLSRIYAAMQVARVKISVAVSAVIFAAKLELKNFTRVVHRPLRCRAVFVDKLKTSVCLESVATYVHSFVAAFRTVVSRAPGKTRAILT